MPVSIEYMSDFARRTSINGFSDEDENFVKGITEQCWLTLIPTIFSIIDEVRPHVMESEKLLNFRPFVHKNYIVLSRAKMLSIDNCVSLLNILNIFFKDALLRNENFPIEILFSEEYFDKFKDPVLNEVRANLISRRRSEAVAVFRERLRGKMPEVDTLTDEMVLSVAGVSV